MNKPTCSEPECQHQATARGLCAKHYQQHSRGNTLPPLAPRANELPCVVEGCERTADRSSMCYPHWRSDQVYGDPTVRKREYTPGGTECTVDGCTVRARAKGLCQTHYMVQRRHGTLDVETRPRRDSTCSVDGCDRKHHANGYCGAHDKRAKATGDPGTADVIARESNADRMCRGPGCERSAHSLGLCATHYAQHAKGRPLTAISEEPLIPRGTPCVVDGCDRASLTRDGVCRTHYRYRHAGDADWDRPIPARAPDGAGHVDKQGYRIVSVDGESRREHHVFAERLLGRLLLGPENVHHKNGDRADNRTDGPFRLTVDGKLLSGNLEVWSKAQPAGQEIGPKLEYAVEILSLYGEWLTGEQVVAVGAALSGGTVRS